MAREKKIGQEIEQVRFFATRYTVFTNRSFAHTPPHPPAATPTVRCNRVAVDVCCSLFKSATRRPPSTVDHRARSTTDLWARHDRTLHPNLTLRDGFPGAHILIRRLLIGLTAYAAHKSPASHLHTHATTNDCANHQAARASFRNLGHTV